MIQIIYFLMIFFSVSQLFFSYAFLIFTNICKLYRLDFIFHVN